MRQPAEQPAVAVYLEETLNMSNRGVCVMFRCVLELAASRERVVCADNRPVSMHFRVLLLGGDPRGAVFGAEATAGAALRRWGSDHDLRRS